MSISTSLMIISICQGDNLVGSWIDYLLKVGIALSK